VIKELIQHIADEDLELNLTIQVGSDRAETLEKQLREIKSLLLREKTSVDITEEEKEAFRESISENSGEPSKALQEKNEEDVEKKDFDYTDFNCEDAEMSEETEEALDEVKEDFEEDVEKNFEESENSEKIEASGDEESDVPDPTEERPGDKKKREAEEDFQEVFGLDDDEDEFEEVFGEDEEDDEQQPTDPPENEPTEEERSEAGADFKELFG